jgi:hypothetical protein
MWRMSQEDVSGDIVRQRVDQALAREEAAEQLS